MKKIQFTKEGLEKIKKEYAELKDVKKPVAVARLQLARSMGDLSENSEYVAAKEDLTFLVGSIAELEVIIANAEIVEEETKEHLVKVGKTVKIRVDNREEEYAIVGEFEADPGSRKLSHTSPIGKALIGKKKGDVVEITVPAGILKYTIVDIK